MVSSRDKAVRLGVDMTISPPGANRAATDILIHELGHSIGGLADEYVQPGTYTGGEPSAPNVSKLTADQMRAQNVKWARFLGQSDPSGGTVGTFEGAMSAEKGIYRSSQESVMRTLGREFDRVGLTAMRAGILAKFSSVDDMKYYDTEDPVHLEVKKGAKLNGPPMVVYFEDVVGGN